MDETIGDTVCGGDAPPPAEPAEEDASLNQSMLLPQPRKATASVPRDWASLLRGGIKLAGTGFAALKEARRSSHTSHRPLTQRTDSPATLPRAVLAGSGRTPRQRVCCSDRADRCRSKRVCFPASKQPPGVQRRSTRGELERKKRQEQSTDEDTTRKLGIQGTQESQPMKRDGVG